MTLVVVRLRSVLGSQLLSRGRRAWRTAIVQCAVGRQPICQPVVCAATARAVSCASPLKLTEMVDTWVS